jgi:chemotaxis methyl-accepting protein methylase
MQTQPPTVTVTLSPQTLAEIRFAGRGKQSRPMLRRVSTVHAPDCAVAAENLDVAEHELIAQVLQSAGHDIGDYRTNPLQRRLRAALRSIRAATVVEGMAKVASDPSLANQALGALMIGYTTSFRDVTVFLKLRDDILPMLTLNGHPGSGDPKAGRGIHVWSAACSNGAELYSLALLLAAQGVLSQSWLRGTDSRRSAIAEATEFGDNFWATVPPEFAQSQATTTAAEFTRQTSRIEWCVEDVLGSRDQSCWELIFCRNLAIYLRPSAAGRLWQIMADALRPGGILVAGKAERPLPSKRWRQLGKCIYQVVK